MVRLVTAIAVLALAFVASDLHAAPGSDVVVVASITIRPLVSLTPSVAVRGADSAQRAALDEALGRFHSAGLELPDVEVVFSDSDADCGGHEGLFERRFDPWRISVCSDLAFVITHELAHAWESANLNDGDRARYLEARELTTWSDQDAPWDERGAEDAAFIIQQNLMLIAKQPASTVRTERIHAYELLVSLASPLGPCTPVCVTDFGVLRR
jgi:hypothetical protein